MARKPLLGFAPTQESIADDLEVTQAVAAVQAEQEMEADVEDNARIAEEIKTQDERVDDEAGTNSDDTGDSGDGGTSSADALGEGEPGNEQSLGDAPGDPASPEGLEGDEELIPQEDEISEVADDLTALESLSERLLTAFTVEDFKEFKTTAGRLSVKLGSDAVVSLENIHVEEANGEMEPAELAFVQEGIMDTLKTIWERVLEFIKSMILAIQTAIQVYKSKLNVAYEDIEKIRATVRAIPKNRKPKLDEDGESVIEGSFTNFLVLEGGGFDSGDMFQSIKKVNDFFRSYFEHIRSNFPAYIDSVEKIFADDKGIGGMTGALKISKDTKPGILQRVAVVEGVRKPMESLIPFKAATMPNGTVLAAFIGTDNIVSTEEDRKDMIASRMFLTLDPSYHREESILEVMKLTEIEKYLNDATALYTTLVAGEANLLQYFKHIEVLQTRVRKYNSDLKILKNSDNSAQFNEVIAHKRKVAMLCIQVLTLTENFYGQPNRALMQYGGRILASAISYSNRASAAYIYKAAPKARGMSAV